MKKLFVFLLLLLLGFGVYFAFNPKRISELQNKIPGQFVSEIEEVAFNQTEEPLSELVAFVNSNVESEIALVIKAENGEGLVAFTDENKIINKIVFQTADGKSGVMQVDETGLPYQLDYEGTVATFENYTETTVDIAVTRNDGTTEVFRDSAIIPQNFGFIPKTFAYTFSEYLSGVGTAVNVVKCGAGLGSILFSGGATTPMAYFGCASLATRMITLNTEIGPCKGDVLDCAKEVILGSLIEEVEKHGPNFLKKGFRLKGIMKNSVTGTPIKNGVIIVENKRNTDTLRGEWYPDSYEVYFRDSGYYSIEPVSEGFAESTFETVLAETKAQIRINKQNLILEKDFEGEDYVEMEMDFFIDPDAFIRGEIIDGKEGDSIEEAMVTLFDEDIVVDEAITDSDGTFVVQPWLYVEGKNFMLRVQAEGYKTQEIEMFVSYEVKENSDEYVLENWSGVVKMEEGKEYWQVTLSNADKASNFCSDSLIALLNQNSMKFDIDADKNVIIQGSQSLYIVSGSAKKSLFDIKVEAKSFASSNLDTVVHLKGSYSDAGKTGNGTWSKPVPVNVRVGEESHYAGCKGTWTAVKQ